MKQETTGLRQRSHSSICVAGAAALFAISASAWAANDLDTPAPVGTLNADGSNTYNAEPTTRNGSATMTCRVV